MRSFMTFLFTASMLILTALPAFGGPDRHEKVIEDMLSVMREFNAVLADVKDESSAKAAEAELEDILQRFQAIHERMDTLDKPSAERDAELMQKYGKELEELTGRFMANAFRVGMDPNIEIDVGLERAAEAMAAITPSSDTQAMGQAEAAATVATLEKEWEAIQEAERTLAAQRAELDELRAQKPEGAGEVEDLEEAVEAKTWELARQLEGFVERVVHLQPAVAGTEAEHELAELRAGGIRAKSDEEILVAQSYIEHGDYSRAIEIYQSALRIDPEYRQLKEKLAWAEEHRYMGEARFSRVEEGMTRKEVREVLGPVNLRNVRQDPVTETLTWYYPKGPGGGAAAVWFQSESGGPYLVREADYNAVEGR